MTTEWLCGSFHTVNTSLLTETQSLAFYTTSVTRPPIKKHFTGKWKLPCGRSHIVIQEEGEIIKLTHLHSTDALKQKQAKTTYVICWTEFIRWKEKTTVQCQTDRQTDLKEWRLFFLYFIFALEKKSFIWLFELRQWFLVQFRNLKVRLR